jgi:hypothetical protein
MLKHNLYATSFAMVYPYYVAKAEKTCGKDRVAEAFKAFERAMRFGSGSLQGFRACDEDW